MVKGKPATKKGSPRKKFSYTASRKAVNDTIRLNGKAKNTTNNYEGHIRRGREYLSKFLEDENCAQYDGRERNIGDSYGDDEDDEITGAAITTMHPQFQNSFDGPPIECTPIAIAMFMRFKCYDEDLGKSTASAIHAAFLAHYNAMAGDKYRGQWKYDDYRKEWIGNPVRCAEVEDMLESCKNKDGEGERKHSRAMTIHDMQKLYAYKKKDLLMGTDGSLSLEDVAEKAESLMFNALASTGFTIWTRNCETTSLQYGHFNFPSDRRKGSPDDPDGSSYFVVNLRNRKNWQKRVKTGDLQLNGHMYKIYPQTKTPAIDMYSCMLDWLDFYEKYLLRRPLQPDDYIFPAVGANGTSVHPKREMTANKAQKMITEMAKKANIRGAENFTTHCFRRGGAQYRFMFAPVGERWTLARIRWWGGWAQGEHRDTLIRYLLDELYTYEEDHSDALCPINHQASLSHAGEHAEVQPMTAAEARELFAQQSEQCRVLQSQLEQFTECSAITQQAFYSAAPLTGPGVSSFQARWPMDRSGSLAWDSRLSPTTEPMFDSPHCQGVFYPDSVPSSATSLSLNLTNLSHNARHVRKPHKSTRTPSLDLPAYLVPEISRSLGAIAWEQVVRDWDEADPSRSHHVALKDWDLAWHRASGESAKYGQRQRIAIEFIQNYGRDAERFKQAYPEHKQGITPLLLAIRSKHQSEGTCPRRQGRLGQGI